MGFSIGIDPDSTTVGVALLDGNHRIVHTEVVTPADPLAPIERRVESLCNTLVDAAMRFSGHACGPILALNVETMHYLDRGRSAEALMHLSVVAGAAAGAFGAMCSVEPRLLSAAQWTRGLPKNVRHNRLLAHYGFDPMKLDEKEARKQMAAELGIEYRNLSHVLDAIDLARQL